MAKKLHTSSSAFVTLCLPYVLFCIKNKTLELEIEETFGDIIDKEIELINELEKNSYEVSRNLYSM